MATNDLVVYCDLIGYDLARRVRRALFKKSFGKQRIARHDQELQSLSRRRFVFGRGAFERVRIKTSRLFLRVAVHGDHVRVDDVYFLFRLKGKDHGAEDRRRLPDRGRRVDYRDLVKISRVAIKPLFYYAKNRDNYCKKIF